MWNLWGVPRGEWFGADKTPWRQKFWATWSLIFGKEQEIVRYIGLFGGTSLLLGLWSCTCVPHPSGAGVCRRLRHSLGKSGGSPGRGVSSPTCLCDNTTVQFKLFGYLILSVTMLFVVCRISSLSNNSRKWKIGSLTYQAHSINSLSHSVIFRCWIMINVSCASESMDILGLVKN